jgi:hypothetical protein
VHKGKSNQYPYNGLGVEYYFTIDHIQSERQTMFRADEMDENSKAN